MSKAPWEIKGLSFSPKLVVLIEIHPFRLCYKPFLSRGHEVKRPQNFFSKKWNWPLTPLIMWFILHASQRGATTVFVSASACNPSFGQGYAHQLIGEKAMTNQNATTIASNIVADENGNINCTNCSDCSDRSDCSECTEGMLFMQELLERHGMLFLSRLQWFQ